MSSVTEVDQALVQARQRGWEVECMLGEPFWLEGVLQAVAVAVYCTSSLFFFQAEDGIRDYKVTGVQTCALPICELLPAPRSLYVRTHLTRFRHVAHHEVLPARVLRDLARGGLRLLVVALAVDHRGDRKSVV